MLFTSSFHLILLSQRYSRIIHSELLIHSYFNIVKREMIDMVPKAISLTLVSYSKENLQRELLQELYKPEVLDELLKESEFVVSRRKELQSMVAALNKAEEYVCFRIPFLCAISSLFIRIRTDVPLLYTLQSACLYVFPKHEANMWYLLFIGLSPVSKHAPVSRTLSCSTSISSSSSCTSHRELTTSMIFLLTYTTAFGVTHFLSAPLTHTGTIIPSYSCILWIVVLSAIHPFSFTLRNLSVA